MIPGLDAMPDKRIFKVSPSSDCANPAAHIKKMMNKNLCNTMAILTPHIKTAQSNG